jgi:predicted alpha/beta-hydrolase family hydrolase
MDAFEAQDQRLPPGGADTETCAHLAQRGPMHSRWEFTFLSQRRQRQDRNLSPGTCWRERQQLAVGATPR